MTTPHSPAPPPSTNPRRSAIPPPNKRARPLPPARTRTTAHAATLALAATLLNGCAPHTIYNERPDQYIQRVAPDDPGPVQAHLAVIEFDDHGVLWKREQLEATLDLIDNANRDTTDGTLVIVYIHGWQNNADPDDPRGALERFKNSLSLNADRHRKGAPFAAEQIVGVFLGWRGDGSDLPIHDRLTFWDRRRTAERVASIHMHETILRIMHATKRRHGSKCFIVGHSMGGMILARILAPALTTILLSADEHGAHLPLDLVILQNPALDALSSWQFIDLLRRFDARIALRSPDGQDTPANGPLIASITSEADTATGRAYPIGRAIASLTTAFRRDHAPGHPSQHHLATHAIGHVPSLTSHTASVRDGQIVIEPIPGAFNTTPFWVIRVSKDISKDHGDVSNPVYGRMIEQLLELNQVYRTDLQTRITGAPQRRTATPNAPR